VLDLFAGSGALGLEALSRGAARAVFVESDHAACRVIERNLDRLRLTGAEVVCRDVNRYLASETRAFDLVFCDPPYGELERRLPELARAAPRLLAEDGLLVLESSSRDPEPELEGLETTSSRRYGAARITLFRR
jgi:16S rRNA (guanine966-N2)-methyltransferase